MQEQGRAGIFKAFRISVREVLRDDTLAERVEIDRAEPPGPYFTFDS